MSDSAHDVVYRPIEAALRDAVRVTGADHASLWLLGEGILRLIRILPESASGGGLELPFSSDGLPWAEPIVFRVANDDEAREQLGALAARLGVEEADALEAWEHVGFQGMRSFGLASVPAGDGVMGYLVVGRTAGDGLQDWHACFLRALARQVGAALETRHKLRISRQRHGVLRALRDAIAALATVPEPTAATQRVVESAARVGGVSSAAVLLYDRNAHQFEATASTGALGEHFESAPWKPRNSDCPLYRTYESETPWVAPAGHALEAFPFLVAVPLAAMGQRFGVLLAVDEQWRPANDELVSSLVTLGQVGAAVLHHAWLHESLTLREGELRRLSDELIDTHEKEKSRIARSIHDVVVQGLAALGLELGMTSDAIHDDALEGALQHVRAIDDLIAETREVVGRLRDELRPRMLDEVGLEAALEWFCKSVAAQSRKKVELHIEADTVDNPVVATALYRAAQEAVTNAIRHGDPSHVDVELCNQDGMVLLSVRDDGRGFDPRVSQSGGRRPGIGLLSMQERARSLHGQLQIAAAPGKGTRLQFMVPQDGKAGEA